MSATTEFDVGPLTWVKGEIDQALAKARELLAQVSGNPGDPSPLRFAQTHIHQVTGALQMVGLEGVTRFGEEIEKLLSHLEKREDEIPGDQAILLSNSVDALGRYLDELVAGEPDQPLRLFPLYRAMQEIRGVEKISESDLFFPDLSVRAPKNPSAKAVSEREFPRFIKSQRARFQRGLLAWLRGNAAGLQDMREALLAIDSTQALPAQRTFWWSAIAFVDSLIAGGLEPDVSAKQLCARVDLQMRRLAEGSPKVAERLLRDTLFFVAKSKPVAESVESVQKTFELDAYLPVSAPEQTAEADRFLPLLRELRETLAASKDAWLKFTSGTKDSLHGFQQQAAKLRDRAAGLDNPSLQQLLDELVAASQAVPTLSDGLKEAVTMEVATALLLAENTLENYDRLTDEFARQADTQARRMRATREDRLDEENIPSIPLLDEMSRKAQEKLLLAQVVHEIKNNLRQIEQVLDAFFRDTSKRTDIPGIDPLMHQVAGALRILDLGKAVRLLEEAQGLTQKFAAPDYEVAADELELLADALSSLGFYIDAVQYGRSDADRIIDPVLRHFMGEEPGQEPGAGPGELPGESEDDAPQPTVESDLESMRANVRAAYDGWCAAPGDGEKRTALENSVKALRQDADLLGDHALLKQVDRILGLVRAGLGDDNGAALAAELADLTGIKLQPVVPSEQAARLVDATDEAIDAELLDTYLEEAREVLERVREHLDITRQYPYNRDSLTVIRRGFHTLKGSGRMVGLTTLGEIAWEVEQVMNKWLEDERGASPALLDMLSLAHDSFATWVEQLTNQGSADVHAERLLELAKLLKQDEESATLILESGPTIDDEPTPAEFVDPPPVTKMDEEPLSRDEALPIVEELPDEFPEVEAVIEDAETDGADAEEVLLEDAQEEVVIELPPMAGEVGPLADTAADMDESQAEPLAEVSGAPVEDLPPADIVIGGVALSPVLFGIFLGEAEQHVGVLKRHFEAAESHPERPVGYDFMRAAHTLCGIARTTGFDAVADLGHGLELWLNDLLEHPRPLDEKQKKVTGDAIAALERMIQLISDHKPPKPAKQIMRSLQSLIKKAAAQREAEEIKRMAEEQAAPEPASTMAEEAPANEGATEATPVLAADDEIILGTEPAEDRRIIHDELDEQLLPIFLEESQELFPEIGRRLREWRDAPNDADVSHSLQRALHTLKGSARMAGAMRLGELTHDMESKVIAAIEADRVLSPLFDELEEDYDRLADALDLLQHGPARKEEAVVGGSEPSQAGATATLRAESTVADEEEFDQSAQKAMLRVRADVIDRLVNEAGEVSIARSRVEGEMQAFKQSLLDLTENVIRLRNQLREVEIQAESQLQSRLLVQQDDESTFDPLEFDRYTRFQELTRMMAESVNDVSTIQQNLLKNLDETEAALLAQSRMTRDLQQDLLHVRMVPLSSVAERLHRVVRQTAKELGKKANLDIRGGQAELDRSVLEKMTGPFEHLLRNAVSHGLEDSPGRHAADKEEIGEIQLEARQEGNEIVLRFSDDGKGIDLEAVRTRGEALGLIQPDADVPDSQLLNLIFAPGFSTASEVTQVSGRGVGMDVVRSEVTGLGGRIEISTSPGKGTTFTIYLPLTLAVTQAVMVASGNNLFAIPSAMVEQVRELKPVQLTELYEQEEVEWNGNRYPFFYLPRLLGDATHQAPAKSYNSVILLRSGAQRAAIHVDDLIGNREVVVKNIGPQLARVSGISGATVLGNGRVVLILNPVNLAYRDTPALAAVPAEAMPETQPSSAPLIMVVDDSLTVRKITSRLLSREGYQVITAKDGVEALQALAENQPAVMLVDIEMPRMDGFELTKNVRGDAATAHIPIIMITSRTAEKHRNYAKELGVDIYLGKPYQEEELLGHIKTFVEQNTSVH